MGATNRAKAATKTETPEAKAEAKPEIKPAATVAGSTVVLHKDPTRGKGKWAVFTGTVDGGTFTYMAKNGASRLATANAISVGVNAL